MTDEVKPSEDVKPTETKAEEKKEEKTPEVDVSLYKNKVAELSRKNDKLKELQEKLDSYSAKEKDEAEKELKKKGKYEELIAEKDKKLEELTKYQDFYTKYETKRLAELEDKIKNVPEDKKGVVEKLLARTTDVDEKYDIVSAFVQEKNETFGKQPNDTNAAEKHKQVSELDKLKQKKKDGKLSPSEKIKYLTLLSQEK